LAAIGDGTRAIIASHPAGVPVDSVALRAACDAQRLMLIEDATDALGATLPDGRPAGTAGHIGCFSLSSGRLLGVGEGGLVITDDAGLAGRVRSLRSHAMTSVTWDRHRGHADSYDIVDIGFNCRLDEPRAALALERLTRLGALVAERRRAAEIVRAAAAGAPGVAPAWPDGLPAGAAPQAIALVAAHGPLRAALARDLEQRGVPVSAWPSVLPGRPPQAEAARTRTVLLDLGCAAEAGLEPAAVAAALADA
jgi:dTDP-4-amino-4,6-dideoxygalactose transaminase